MTTDVYPRENCIAPAIVLIVWTTDTTNGCGLAPDCVPILRTDARALHYMTCIAFARRLRRLRRAIGPGGVPT